MRTRRQRLVVSMLLTALGAPLAAVLALTWHVTSLHGSSGHHHRGSSAHPHLERAHGAQAVHPAQEHHALEHHRHEHADHGHTDHGHTDHGHAGHGHHRHEHAGHGRDAHQLATHDAAPCLDSITQLAATDTTVASPSTGAIVHCRCDGYGNAGDHRHQLTVWASEGIRTKGMGTSLRTAKSASHVASHASPMGAAGWSHERDARRTPRGLSPPEPLYDSLSRPSLSQLCTLLL